MLIIERHCPGLFRTIKCRFIAILTMYLKRSLWVYTKQNFFVHAESIAKVDFFPAKFAKTVICDVERLIRHSISIRKPKRGSFTEIISPSRPGVKFGWLLKKKRTQLKKCLWLCCFWLRKEQIRGQWLKWFSTCSNLQIYYGNFTKVKPGVSILREQWKAKFPVIVLHEWPNPISVSDHSVSQFRYFC